MLKGFEIETAPLSEKEKKLIPAFIRGFQTKVGKANAISNTQIIEKFKGKYPDIQITGARVRKIINYIRINQLVPGLIATSDGYYISRNPSEIKRYLESLEGREKAIRQVRMKTAAYYKQLIEGRQTLIDLNQ